MSKTLLLIQARCDSSRLPNKPLFELAGKPAFVHVAERVLDACPDIDYVAVMTPQEIVNDPLERIAKQFGYDVVRNPQHLSIELERIETHYGLTEDDFCVYTSADAPFHYAKHVPFCLDQMREHGADVMKATVQSGTLGAAGGYPPISRAQVYHRVVEQSVLWDIQGAVYIRWKHYGKFLLVDLPSYLDEPWEWGPVNLDWPLQALAIKWIYQELYKGKPIDIRDVRALYEQDPHLANLVPKDALLANQPMFPHGGFGLEQQSIINTCDYVRVKLEEDDEEKTGGMRWLA